MLKHLRAQSGQFGLCDETLPAAPTWPLAAVLLAVTDDPLNPEIILTQRAGHLSTHSGEVSFPGGKVDDTDGSFRATALRESQEEIGLEPSEVEVLGQLPSVLTRWKIDVTPIVGIVPKGVGLTPNFDEIDSIFHVPVSFFVRDQRVRTDVFRRGHVEFWAPVYHFEGYKIWGFTAGIIVSFINQVYSAGISEDSSDAPKKIFT